MGEVLKDERPIWLLDVDGVVNANGWARREVDFWPKESVKHELISVNQWQRYHIFVAEGLIDFINEMHASGKVEIVWATTWLDHANTHLAPAFGLPTLEVGARPIGMDDHYYKHRAARAGIAAGRRVIWTDDVEITAQMRQEFTESGLSHLLIAPDEVYGLTPADCAKIREFVG